MKKLHAIRKKGCLREACDNCIDEQFCESLEQSNLDNGGVIHERSYILERGEYLISRKDNNPYSLYSICSGSCKSLLKYCDYYRVVDFHLPGEILGVDKYVGCDNNHDVISNERTVIKEFIFPSIKDLGSILVSKNIAHACGTQLALLQEKRESICCKSNTLKKVASFICYVVRQQKIRNRQLAEFKMPLTRGELSEYFGLAAETISRQITRLEKKRIIQIHGQRIAVLDHMALQKISGNCPAGLNC